MPNGATCPTAPRAKRRELLKRRQVPDGATCQTAQNTTGANATGANATGANATGANATGASQTAAINEPGRGLRRNQPQSGQSAFGLPQRCLRYAPDAIPPGLTRGRPVVTADQGVKPRFRVVVLPRGHFAPGAPTVTLNSVRLAAAVLGAALFLVPAASLSAQRERDSRRSLDIGPGVGLSIGDSRQSTACGSTTAIPASREAKRGQSHALVSLRGRRRRRVRHGPSASRRPGRVSSRESGSLRSGSGSRERFTGIGIAGLGMGGGGDMRGDHARGPRHGRWR